MAIVEQGWRSFESAGLPPMWLDGLILKVEF